MLRCLFTNTCRILLLLSGWILVMTHTQAQGDSLLTAWKDADQPDSLRLQALQTLAWKTVFENPDSGMSLASEQFAYAKRIKDPKAQYEALTTLAVGSSVRSDHNASLEFLQQGLALAQRMGDRKREANAYSNMSNVYRNLGDLPMALEQLQKSLRIDTELGNKEGLTGTYNNIGNIHTELEQLPEALMNYQRSAALADELNNKKGRAQALLNLGNTHMQMGALDTAHSEFLRGAQLYKELGRKLELGLALNNLGRVNGSMHKIRVGHAYLDSAEVLLTELGSMRHVVRTQVNRGDLYLLAGDPAAAVRACSKGNLIANDNGLLLQRKECLGCLETAYAQLADFKKAHAAQKEFILVSDSLLKLNNGKEVTRMEVTRSFEDKMLADSLANVSARFNDQLEYQERIGREREQRNLFLYSAIGVLLLAGGLWNRLRYTRRSRAAVQLEKDRSDDLLHNILPVDVAAELKETGTAVAKHVEEVTILFTDFKGFTAIAEKLSPTELVAEIDACFRAFDAIMEKYHGEKIKTIGDAYMAAGGVPQYREGSALAVVNAALDMQAFMLARKAEHEALGKPAFDMRVGVHTGPVVAGIVGLKKFQYDIWGDAVNTASRMESSGEIGKVNISSTTYGLIQGEPGLSFTSRGMVQAKGKGDLAMYYVQRS
ncbi:MAG: tetratricopeptide repeat protein [Flavobacteriales bacterium]|nr:tetratricopeptide repeat protein [Flavobacteriales bacterium]